MDVDNREYKARSRIDGSYKIFYVETQIGRKPRAATTTQRSTMIGMSTEQSQSKCLRKRLTR